MAESRSRTDARNGTAERRHGPRFRSRQLTDGSIVGKAGAEPHCFLGTTVNVASGGALLRTYEPLTAGQQIELTVHLPEGDLSATGIVLHVEPDAVGCRMAGVRFVGLPAAATQLLMRHLRSFDRAPKGATKPGEARPAPANSSGSDSPMTADEPPSRTGTPRKSVNAGAKTLREPRLRTTTVFPFEGQIQKT